jgi:hypothetical protein
MMAKKRYAMFLFFVLSIILCSDGTTLGATFPVSTTQEFRQALLSATGNGEADTILLADGTYKTTDDGGGTFTFSDNDAHDLTIQGSSPENVILSGEDTDRVLSFTSTTSTATIHLVGLSVVQGSSDTNGGGIYAGDLYSVTLTNCALSGNIAGSYGGGFYGIGPLTVTNSSLTGNTAGSRGGGFYGGGLLTLLGSTITDNTAGTSGGGFHTVESPSGAKRATVTNCRISGNTAGEDGGGFYAGGSPERTTTVTNSILSDNTANSSGAGFFTNGTATIMNSIIINSTAAEGIYLHYGEENYILNSVFIDNYNYDVAGPPSVAATIYNNYIEETKINLGASDRSNNIFGGDLDFADESMGDFHIGSNSVLIDAGTTAVSGITFPETDYEGYSRIVGSSIDIGPYEFSNTRPTIHSFTYSGFPQVQSEMTFTLDATPYGGRTITKYEWDFDYDGVYDDEEFESAEPQSTHTYTEAGTYTVRVKVTDSAGEFSWGSMGILILPIVEAPLLEKIAEAFADNDSDAIADAVDEMVASGLSPNALAQALSDAFGVGLGILVEKNQTIETLNTTIDSMYTLAELELAVSKWDVDGDGKVSLADVIYGLQVLSGNGSSAP